MNSIFNSAAERVGSRVVKFFVYADDIVILVSGRVHEALRKSLQETVTSISSWASERGLSIAPEKSKHLHICPKLVHDELPDVKLNGSSIPSVKSVTVLGVTFNTRFDFQKHANETKKVCKSRINLLRYIGRPSRGGSRQTLLYIAKAMIIPKIFHGWGLVSRGGKRIEKLLEPVYNDILRVTSGAFQTSPIVSLCAESGELPFEYLACQKLVVKASKLEEKKKLSNYEGEWPLLVRARTISKQMTGKELLPVAEFPLPLSRSWMSETVSVDWTIKAEYKVGEAPSKARALFGELQETKYADFKHFYTDGSVDEEDKVGMGMFGGEEESCGRLSSGCTIFSAEAKALLQALQSVVPGEKAVIFTDSASCVSAIEADTTNHPWIREIQLEMERKNAIVCWIPGHTGIAGNERADTLANSGRTAEILDPQLPAIDRISWSKKCLEEIWEGKWYWIRDVKLRMVKPSTARWNDRNMRHEQVLLTRLRIGHTRITHEWLLQRKEAGPICQFCGTYLTVQHLLVECQEFEGIRRDLELKGNICEILCYESEREERLLKFLKRSKLTKKI